MMNVPVIRYEYVPPGGDPDRPIKIEGRKRYRPGDHGKGADVYVFDIPQGMVEGMTTWEVSDWQGVLDNLAHWFGDAEAQSRLKQTYVDLVQFPQFR